MDIHEILKKLPHRYPFLMVDRVLELEHGKRIRALKNVTANEPYFQGHFPHRPVMPGVMMLESLAQTAAICLFDAGLRADNKASTTSPASTGALQARRSSRATSCLDVGSTA
jgi:3-hydroxyacyl-[acyl-carrier-protein] dehydratase